MYEESDTLTLGTILDKKERTAPHSKKDLGETKLDSDLLDAG